MIGSDNGDDNGNNSGDSSGGDSGVDGGDSDDGLGPTHDDKGLLCWPAIT